MDDPFLIHVQGVKEIVPYYALLNFFKAEGSMLSKSQLF